MQRRGLAIIVTLLALDLKAPALHPHASVSEPGRQLLDLSPKFLSRLISFISKRLPLPLCLILQESHWP